MIGNKSKRTILIFTIISLLILGSISSIGISIDATADKKIETTSIKLGNSLCKIRILSNNHVSSSSQSDKISSCSIISLDATESENIVVTNTIDNEYYPSMVSYGHYTLVAYENEDDDGTNVYLRTSDNYGETWSNKLAIIDSIYNLSSPSLCVKSGKKHAFCTFVSDFNRTGLLFDVELKEFNIDPNKIYAIDWSNISYNKTSDEIYGICNFSPSNIAYVR